MKKYLLFILICLAFYIPGQAQLQSEITFKNAEIIDSTVYFDIHIRSLTTETINLSFSDIVFKVNEDAFQSPSFSKVTNPNPPGPVQAGYCNFTPTNTDNNINDWFCQSNYYNATSPEIVNDQFVINLDPLTPSDQNAFDDIVAIIDQGTNHILGKFKITGYQSGDVTLTWVAASPGLRTKIFSLDNFPPFTATQSVVTVGSPLVILGPSATKNQGLNKWKIDLFPNPTSDLVNLQFEKLPAGNLTYDLIDIIGRVQQSGEISSLNTEISLEKLAKGTYWINLKTTDGSNQSHKLIKL